MKFGNYEPTSRDDGNGFTTGERHLYEFPNGYGASVLTTTEASYAQYPEFYPGEEVVGLHELCVVNQGVPLAMFRAITGVNIPDPLGETTSGVHVGLSEAEVTAMLSRLETAEALEAA